MNIGELLRIISDAKSSGTLYDCDELVILDENNNQLEIKTAECDTQSSDFNINVK